jgi:hypothetical protein
MADRFGLGLSFIVPLMAYTFIAVFAVAARRSPMAADLPPAVVPIP